MKAIPLPSIQKILSLGPCGVLALLWLSVPGLAGLALLWKLGDVSNWLASLGWWGPVVYSAAFLVTSGLGLLPTTAQAILGGWVFGFWEGLLAASLAFGGAALIGHGITRIVAKQKIMELLESNPKAAAIRNAILGGGFWKNTLLIALLRLPPQSPFAFTNFVFSSCGAPLLPFVLGTILGLLPRTALLMALSSAAAQTGATDIQSFLHDGPGWPAAALGIATFVLAMSVIGLLAKQALKNFDLPSDVLTD